MRLAEAALLLTHAAAVEDRPPPEEAKVAHWHAQVGHLPFEDAWVAMSDHYDEESRRLWPADLLRRVEAMREAYVRRHPDAVACPPGCGRAPRLPEYVARRRAELPAAGGAPRAAGGGR